MTAGAALLAGCGAGAPKELNGLWASGPAACEAGLGVRFSDGAVSAHVDGAEQVLLEAPRYDLERRGTRVRVRIDYAPPGGRRASPVRGVLVLERGDDGWLNAVTHRLEDSRTGGVQMRLRDDAMARIFRLRPCGEDAWIEGLRGRQR
ncbi:MAG: hypothetical protein GC206_00115 [Alphaproteobacteria bacterium]|nr:hypothetical protein [Alphaproteobacteria bacterium]